MHIQYFKRIYNIATNHIITYISQQSQHKLQSVDKASHQNIIIERLIHTYNISHFTSITVKRSLGRRAPMQG